MEGGDVDLNYHQNEPEVKAEEVVRRRGNLLAHGFPDAWVDKLAQKTPTLYSISQVNDHISGLSDRGFTNPKKMIETLPSILSLAFDNIDAKLDGLQQRGFTNPNKMIETVPAILSYSFDNIDAKLDGLQQRGFTNPNKMIETSPNILGFAFDNIDAKLQGLRDRGFTNPNKMIESSPSILNLAFDNIDRRLKFLDKMINLYSLDFTPVQLMEEVFPLSFSTKMDKVFVIARILREYKVQPGRLNTKMIRNLIGSNLEDTLVALDQSRPEDESIDDFISRVKQVKKQDLSKDEKRRIIREGLADFEKIKERYFRGYPDES